MSCGCGCSGEAVAYEDWGEEDVVSAAEYKGKKVTLNKPFRTKGGPKKFGVYTKNEKGNVVLVRFGDPNMEIKRDDPQRRKNFRSRHNCDSPGPKWKARYWSCRQWRPGKKVEAGGCGCDQNAEAKDKDDPCTEGYEQYGMKMKDGRKVPNCIPIKKKAEADYKVCANCISQEMCSEHGACMEAKHKKDHDDYYSQEMPQPKGNETHDEFMSRCEAMGHSRAECMEAHKGHEFQAYVKENRPSCAPGEEFRDGKCRAISVTIELDVEDARSIVEASTGKTIIEISGIAFHEGFNKNKWSISRAGVQNVVEQMVGADLTLHHPKPTGHGFARNMNGGVEEAVVGTVKEAWVEEVQGGWNVRYIAHVVRSELFDALESGLWTRGDFGVSIGGYGVPDAESEDGVVFGSDFTFDHLAIVYRPAYKRANIEQVKKIEATEENVQSGEDEITFKYQTDAKADCRKEANEMSDETEIEMKNDESEALVAEIEALKASMVLQEATIAEFKAAEDARAEEDRMNLVRKASEMGLKGHEEFSSETLNTMIASWESSRPTFEAAVPATSEPTETAVASEEPKAVVANYLNGTLIESDESLYARAYNAWASAWNRTLSGLEVNEGMRAGTYDEVKENL